MTPRILQLSSQELALWLRHSVSASLRAYSAAAEARAMAASRSARAASRCSSAESFATVLEEAALPVCSCFSLSRRSLSRALAWTVPLTLSRTPSLMLVP